MRPQTDTELDAVIDALAEDLQTLTIVQLDSVLGARRGELCAPRWTDIDFDAATITIARAISDGWGGEGLVEHSDRPDERRRRSPALSV